MDKMTFASYKFKASDVIEGLNRYFAETKAYRYRRASLEIRNGVWTSNPDYRKDIVFTNSYSDALVTTKASERGWKYYLICDPEEVVGVAINWLREEHDIFYTPGMKVEDVSRPDDAKDIFDTPRYRFLSILSAELGFRTIVGPGNADKTEDAIMRAVKCRNDELKKLREDRAKYKGWLNTMYGASCGDNVLPCYRYTCNNPKAIKERDAAKDALAELRAKIREVHRGVFSRGLEVDCGYTSALDDILKEFRFQKKLKEKAEEKTVEHKMDLNKCREYILTVYREIFDCSNGDPEGSDKENLEDILEEYRRVTKRFEEKFAECDNLKRRLHAERAMCDHLRKENSRQCSYREEFLRKLCKEFGFTIDKCPNYLPAMEDNILNSVKTLSESFDGANGELEEMTVELNELRKSHDNLSELYNAATKLLGEYLKEAKDILGIDSCDKDTVASAIKALKSAYNSLRNDYDEVCEGYTKLKKDYDELDEAYSSVLKWNNSYADVRRLLEVPADADAGVMVGALNKFMCDYENLQKAYDKAKCNTNYFHEFEKECRERRAYLSTLCEALGIDENLIGGFFKDQESAILKAIEENHEAMASIDQLRKKWHERYTSEHIRANGEHKRAEKCFGEIAALKTQVASLERSLKASANEQVGIDAFRNEIRRLEAEKSKVINALGQDIWDDCVR